MSDRIDFFEIRAGNEDWHDYDTVCLVKEQDEAEKIMKFLQPHYTKKLFIEHVEVVAHVNLELSDY